MAEALISAVLKQLISFAGRQIEQEWSLVSGIEEKVESLTSNLEDIRVLLVDAEKRQIKEESVKRWLNKIKAVSYEMDTALDEWNTAIILRSNLKLWSKVRFFTDPYLHHNQVHRPGLRRRIACTIKEVNGKLDGISTDRVRYTLGATSSYSNEYEGRPDTTSIVDASEVYGRDKEKSILVSKLLGDWDQATRKGQDSRLLSESNQTAGKGHDIIPIVGMGGVGKTTLVKLVYNDNTVDRHFELKIWVCVSYPFNTMRIAKAIVEALKVENAHQLVEFQALIQCIQDSIRDKRFLLVLDDVWTEDYCKWEQIEKSIRTGAIGSKILVTTRKEEVATMMRAKNSIFTLKCLSEEDCCYIFNQIAFLDKEKCEQLEEVGKKIARKCKGLPLVAKALGSLMQFKNYTMEHWEGVLHSELWELGDQVQNEVFVPFLLSYNDLPPLERCCFLYCSCFPKDYTIDRDELIQLWMSQGYLSSTRDDERKGVDCFENLAKRSFLQDFEIDEDGNVIKCKMHDIVHDFVLFLMKNEYLNTIVKTKEDGMKLLQAKALHCTLLIESEAQEVPTSVYGKRNLRTLSVGNLGSIRWDLLSKLTCLRTLNLSHCSFSKLPKDVDELILLRYLNLSHNGQLKKLPKTLCNLFNLQTLKLEDCAVNLPMRIKKLVNLRHLYLGTSRSVRCPKQLGELTSLETLDHYISVNPPPTHRRKYKSIELEDLKRLNHLKGRLRISGIASTRDVDQARRAELNRKERIVALELKFGGDGPNGISEEQYSLLLEGLQPHPNLKHLEICAYGGTRVFPCWMTELNNLKRLVLLSCNNCEALGPFGKLPFLESLIIQDMSSVKRVGQEFLGIEDTTGINGSRISLFPELKQLQLLGLYSCEEWEPCADSGLIIMPCLVSLEIRCCPVLKAPLPEFLRRTQLEKLTIKDCPILEQRIQEGLGTEDLVEILTSPTLEFINVK